MESPKRKVVTVHIQRGQRTRYIGTFAPLHSTLWLASPVCFALYGSRVPCAFIPNFRHFCILHTRFVTRASHHKKNRENTQARQVLKKSLLQCATCVHFCVINRGYSALLACAFVYLTNEKRLDQLLLQAFISHELQTECYDKHSALVLFHNEVHVRAYFCVHHSPIDFNFTSLLRSDGANCFFSFF